MKGKKLLLALLAGLVLSILLVFAISRQGFFREDPSKSFAPRVTLQYLQSIEDRILVRLTNHSKANIVLEGNVENDLVYAAPRHTPIECQQKNEPEKGKWFTGPFALLDGSTKEIVIATSQSRTLAVYVSRNLAQMSNRCRIRLVPKGKDVSTTEIVSDIFKP